VLRRRERLRRLLAAEVRYDGSRSTGWLPRNWSRAPTNCRTPIAVITADQSATAQKKTRRSSGRRSARAAAGASRAYSTNLAALTRFEETEYPASYAWAQTTLATSSAMNAARRAQTMRSDARGRHPSRTPDQSPARTAARIAKSVRSASTCPTARWGW